MSVIQRVKTSHRNGYTVVCAPCGFREEMETEEEARKVAHMHDLSKHEGAPTQSATKAEWVDYAVSQGADRETAEEMTKADLLEHFAEGGEAEDIELDDESGDEDGEE